LYFGVDSGIGYGVDYEVGTVVSYNDVSRSLP